MTQTVTSTKTETSVVVRRTFPFSQEKLYERFANTEERDNHEGGWHGCLIELERYLEGSS